MCGILITDDIEKRDLIKHRGTESGFVYHPFCPMHIVHWRLPIQTVEGDKWGQPIRVNGVNKGHLMFNGEIFNCPEGYSSDTQYLVALFESLDIGGILQEANKWDGFWAIVFRTEDGADYCFTDPLGKKQLYYNLEGEICSEIRPLINAPKETFDQNFKSSAKKWGYNRNDRTPYSRIRRVIPNRLYTFYRRGLVSVSYKDYYDWTLGVPTEESLKWLMIQAVKRRLVSKTYTIGALVSGGLDSSIIAKILCDLDADVKFYTIENNESKYIRTLENFLGIKVKYVDYKMGDEGLLDIYRYNETPIDLGSVVPQHKLMEVIPETIVLTGDGADELFGGYKRTKDYDSQRSDVFEELPYYHLPRLDRASMRFTKELRSPFLSHDVVKFALSLPYSERIDKGYLKRIYGKDLPLKILLRDKLALKNERIVQDPKEYSDTVFDMFYNTLNHFGE
jgi:asparagine synthase (glutamine-hydrolysing)